MPHVEDHAARDRLLAARAARVIALGTKHGLGDASSDRQSVRGVFNAPLILR